MKQKLYCQPGNHFWERDPQKGRKPRACPEHTEHVVTPTVTRASYAVINSQGLARLDDGRKVSVEGEARPDDIGMVELIDGKWHFSLFERPTPVDDVVDTVLTEIDEARETESVMETLQCKQGHSWERPRQRGKKPQWCPEHRPQPRRQGLTKEERVERLLEGKAQKAAERRREQLDGIRAEYAKIDPMITRADRAYDGALKNALKVVGVGERFEHLWHIADQKMDALIAVLARKRYLEKALHA